MEISCFLYSEKDGNKIKSWNIAQQVEAHEEYRQRRLKGEEIGYYEGVAFPLDTNIGKYNSVKKVFEFKTDREMVESGDRILKKYEKIVLNSIVYKEMYEMYIEGLVLNKPLEKVYKIDKNNRVVKKNIIELFKEKFSEKEIKDAILEKVIAVIDKKYTDLRKKYPDFEFINFNYKASTANIWMGLSDPAKIRIIRSDSRLNSFNVILAEFFSSLTKEEQEDENVIFIKINEVCSNIIEKEKKYKENYENLIQKRNYFTGKLRDLILNEGSIKAYLNEIN